MRTNPWARPTGPKRRELLRAAAAGALIAAGGAASAQQAAHNHFEIPETLANPYGLLGRAVLEQMKLVHAKAGVARPDAAAVPSTAWLV